MIKIWHYSDVNSKKLLLNPSNFGKNTYTKRDFSFSSMPRIFFYKNPLDKEVFFEAARLYQANIDEKTLYNLTLDKEKLFKKIVLNSGFPDIDGILKYIIKSLKYNGIIYKSDGIDIVSIFKKIEVIQVPQDC